MFLTRAIPGLGSPIGAIHDVTSGLNLDGIVIQSWVSALRPRDFSRCWQQFDTYCWSTNICNSHIANCLWSFSSSAVFRTDSLEAYCNFSMNNITYPEKITHKTTPKWTTSVLGVTHVTSTLNLHLTPYFFFRGWGCLLRMHVNSWKSGYGHQILGTMCNAYSHVAFMDMS